MPFYVILNVFVKLKSNYFLLKVKSQRGMLRLTGVRRISITYNRLIQRERIDKTPEKQKPKPRFQSAPGINNTVLYRLYDIGYGIARVFMHRKCLMRSNFFNYFP